MRTMPILFLILLLCSASSFSQVAINADGSEPDPSAGLDVKFTNKGVLFPRMTFDQLNAIVNPADGLMVLCTNCTTDGNPVIYLFFSGKWRSLMTTCAVPSIPAEGNHTPQVNQITWSWTAMPTATGYKWSGAYDYSTAIDVGNDTTYTETGLDCFTGYSRYVWAYNECGPSSLARQITQTTLPITFSPSPTAGTHVSGYYQIEWQWNAVTGATGYKWSTTNDFNTATDMGTTTSHTEYGLTCGGTSYSRYVWAYDVCGYSVPTTLTTSTTTCPANCQPVTDVRDGKTYRTVLIGTQCWMQENLNIGTRINGSQIQTNNSTIEKYCYNDLESNCTAYGGLYHWNEAMQYVTTQGAQGICPEGWHLPTDADWTTLSAFLGGGDYAGGNMKETGTTHWSSPNTGATNESGFTALPGGYIYPEVNFYDLTHYAYYWSTTRFNTVFPYYWFMSDQYTYLYQNYNLINSFGRSVRCLKE